MRGGHAFLDFDNLAFEPVSGADLHDDPRRWGIARDTSRDPLEKTVVSTSAAALAEFVRPDRSSPCPEAQSLVATRFMSPRAHLRQLLNHFLFTSSEAAK